MLRDGLKYICERLSLEVQNVRAIIYLGAGVEVTLYRILHSGGSLHVVDIAV